MQIHWHDVHEIDEDTRQEVETRIAALEEGHRDLIDLRISGRSSGHHRHGDKEIRITCQARGTELVATRTCPDLAQALGEAVEVFEREVRRLRDKRRDFRRNSAP